MTPQEFISTIAEAAQQFQIKTNVFASVTIAQACLETGFLQFTPMDKHTGQQSFNLFGTKGTGPAGCVTCETWEVYNGKRVTLDAQFRAYNNFYESLADHGDVLTLDRYVPVRNAPTAEEAAMQLHPCGYATDPAYGEKLVSIIHQYGLTTYDLTKEEITLFRELEEKVQKLEAQIASSNDQTVSDWAAAAIEKAKLKGILKGDEYGNINPKAPITREQIVVVLDRLGLLG